MSELEELARRFAGSQSLQDLILWLRQRVRTQDSSLSGAEIFDYIHEFSECSELWSILAQVEGVAPEQCLQYMKTIFAVSRGWAASSMAFDAAVKTQESWDALYQLRGTVSQTWLSFFEQPSSRSPSVLPMRAGWIGFGLGKYRSCGGTYQCFDYETLPDLPRHLLRNLTWLEDQVIAEANPNQFWQSQLSTIESMSSRLGHELPLNFRELWREYLARGSFVESCTDCYFTSDFVPVKAFGGVVVPFYNDSQSCATWALWFHRSGCQAVVSCQLDWEIEEPDNVDLAIGSQKFESSDETNPQSDCGGPLSVYPAVTGVVDESGARLRNFRYVAPSLEAFIARIWIENEIWFGLHDYGRKRDLNRPELRSYLSQLC